MDAIKFHYNGFIVLESFFNKDVVNSLRTECGWLIEKAVSKYIGRSTNHLERDLTQLVKQYGCILGTVNSLGSSSIDH